MHSNKLILRMAQILLTLFEEKYYSSEIRAGKDSEMERNPRWRFALGRTLRRESAVGICAGKDFEMEIRAMKIRAWKDFSSLWVRRLGFLPSLRASYR